MTLQRPKPPPNIDTGCEIINTSELLVLEMSQNPVPCIKSYQGCDKVKRLDNVEFGAVKAKEDLAQPNSHLIETQVG